MSETDGYLPQVLSISEPLFAKVSAFSTGSFHGFSDIELFFSKTPISNTTTMNDFEHAGVVAKEW